MQGLHLHLRRRTAGLLAVLALGGFAMLGGPLATRAWAAGDASAAASFLENAQNSDGGFGAERHQASRPQASLWATVALLAAGKNPQAEALNNGASADAYLAAHLGALRSLPDLGLLAIVQAGAQLQPVRYGDPAAQLRSALTATSIRSDPGGAALGVLGLLAIGDGSSRAAAQAAARTLLGSPDGDGGWGSRQSDSATTALVLEAVAESGVAGTSNPAVQAGLRYLHAAQVNDGSIATSDRTDPSSTGDVAATAFTIQALAALHGPQLKTSTGTTVLAGLADYQQQGTGGLSPFGAYDTGVAPSVLQTAQAYPAFDGVAFPLPAVPYTPVSKPRTTTAPAPQAVNRISAGASGSGISSAAASGPRRVAAFQGASAAGSSKAGHATPRRGPSVTGSVVGATQAPKLTTRAGRGPGTSFTGPLLGGALLLLALLGGYLDSRRPRRSDRSAAARWVALVHDRAVWLWARGSLAPLAVLLVAAVLILLPSATGMWSRAPQGARMITALAPYMRAGELAHLQGDVALIGGGVSDAVRHGAALQFAGVHGRARFLHADPQLATFAHQWTGIHRRFEALLQPMQANVGNYDAVAALPSFDLFPWLFVIPGALLALAAILVLLVPRWWRRLRWVVLALGVALVLAPVAFGMLSRAPKGARLVSAFAHVENRGRVTAAQNDFASLAVGQGALTTELLPALKRQGARVVARELPGVTAFDDHFVAILGDLTPLLGAMSDNVARYEAVAALPSFDAFPWLFALPGLLAAACVLLPMASRGRLQAAYLNTDSKEDHHVHV